MFNFSFGLSFTPVEEHGAPAKLVEGTAIGTVAGVSRPAVSGKDAAI